MLGHEVDRARLSGASTSAGVVLHAEHHDGAVGRDVTQGSCGLDAVKHGHLDVHQDDIRPDARDLGDGYPAVSSFANDDEVWFHAEAHPEALPHGVLVVYEEESNLVHHDVSIVAATCVRIVRHGEMRLILQVRGSIPQRGDGG